MSIAEPKAKPVVGPYQLAEVLAQGGMGIVYRAVDLRDGTEVALKTVFSERPEYLSSIRREVETLSRIRHRGVVRVLDRGVHQGMPWYAMELLEGRTLRELIRGTASSPPDETLTARERRAPTSWDPDVEEPVAALPLAEALALVQRICAPLAFVHGEGVVHRDLKPSNVFLRGDDYEPVLVDFGLVQRFGGSAARDALHESDGPPAGTFVYMSPEQLAEGVLDPRTDIYALGCMLYELCVGQPPFRGSAAQLTFKHLREPPAPPSSIIASLPRELDALIARMLAKRPADRIGYAQDVAAAIARIREGLGGAPERSQARSGRDYLYRPDLIGRREILDALVTAAGDPSRRVVLLCGESGAGKTRLAAELARRLRLSDIRVAKGACLPLHGARAGGAPLHAFSTVLRDIADHCRAGGAREAARILGSRGAVLAMYEPSLAELVGGPLTAPLPSTDASRARLNTWLAETLSEYAGGQPLVLLIDDVQWADEVSLGFLRAVGTGAAPLEDVHIVCASRSGSAAERELRGLAATREIELGALDAAAVRALAGEMLASSEPPAALLDALIARSNGNPFLVVELLHAAVAMGVVHRDDDGVWVEGRSAPGLPETLEELVRTRFDHFGQAPRELLELASAFGAEVEMTALTEASDLVEADVLAVSGELIARDVLHEPAPGIFVFRHPALRETIYERAAPERRRSLHLEIARTLAARHADARTLAFHWDRAGAGGRAAPLYLRAAEEAQRMAASAEACRMFDRGFALERESAIRQTDGIARARVDLAYGEALYGVGRLDDAEEALRGVLRGVGSPVPDVSAGWMLRIAREGIKHLVPPARSSARALLGRLIAGPVEGGSEPASWLEARARDAHVVGRPLHLVASPDEEASVVALRALDTLASILLARADGLGQLGVALAGANLAERAAPGVGAASGLARMGLLAGMAGLEEASSRYMIRARESAASAGMRAPPRVLMMESLVSLVRGRWSRLREVAAEGVAVSRENGDFQVEVQVRLFEAGAALVRGNAAECLAIVEQTSVLAERHGYELEQLHLLGNRAGAHIHRRELREADDALVAMERALGAGSDPVARTLHKVLTASAALLADDDRAARRLAGAALEALDGSPRGSPGYLVHFTFLSGVLLGLADRAGERPDARAHAAIGRLRAQARMQPAGRAALMLYQGAMARLEGKPARRLLSEAAGAGAALGIEWVEGAACWELARLGGVDAPRHRERGRSILEHAGAASPPFYAPAEVVR